MRKKNQALIETNGNKQLNSYRELSLHYNIPVEKTVDFWEGIKKGKLVSTKCKKCGRLFFPPKIDCTLCLTSEVEWVELSGEAELETFTYVVVSPASFNKYGPYICAIGRLKEDIRVLAWLKGIEYTKVKVGMKLKLKPKVAENGRLTYEYSPIT